MSQRSAGHATIFGSRRRTLLIRPADQFRTALVPTAGAAILLVLLLALFHQVSEERTRALSEANPAFADVLGAHSSQMESTVAAGSILYVLGILVIGLAHSRRTMGALFAIHRRLRRLGEGDVTGVLRLRRRDYFHDVADAANAAIGSIRKEAEADLADVDDLLSLLDRAPGAGPFRDGLATTLQEIRDRKRRLLGLSEEPSAPRLRIVEGGRP